MSEIMLYLDDRRIIPTFVMSLVLKNHGYDVPGQGFPVNNLFGIDLCMQVNFKLMHPLNRAVNPDHALAMIPRAEMRFSCFGRSAFLTSLCILHIVHLLMYCNRPTITLCFQRREI